MSNVKKALKNLESLDILVMLVIFFIQDYFFKNKIEVGILEYFVGAEDLSRDWLVLLNYRRFEGIEVFDKEFDP